MSYVSTVLTFIFIENVVLTYFLGICPFLTSTRNVKTAFRIGIVLTVLMTLLSVVTWAARRWILLPLGAEHLQLVVFAFLIGVVGQLSYALFRRWSPRRIAVARRYFVLIVANASLFGILLISSYRSYAFLDSLLAAAAGGIGFLLAVVGLAAVRERLEYEAVPGSFRGGPIILISAGLFSLAFQAFDKLFLMSLFALQP